MDDIHGKIAYQFLRNMVKKINKKQNYKNFATSVMRDCEPVHEPVHGLNPILF
jgi:hypothetical protein